MDSFVPLSSTMSQNVFSKTRFSSSDHLISHQFYILLQMQMPLFSMCCYLNEITSSPFSFILMPLKVYHSGGSRTHVF